MATDSEYQTSLAEAHHIAGSAGIILRWLRCDSGSGAGVAQCAEQLGPNEVVLRIADSGKRPAGAVVSMGFSLIDRGLVAPARFSTVWVDRVHSMADRAGADPGRLLGRAIAHELGHLLLNDTTHSPTGLMRAAWTLPDLRRNAERDWHFETADAYRMRATLTSRARTPPDAPSAGGVSREQGRDPECRVGSLEKMTIGAISGGGTGQPDEDSDPADGAALQ